MKNFISHIRVYVLRGLLAAIPLSLSLLAVRLIYVAIDKQVMNLIDNFIGYRIPGLGIVFVILVLYLIGLLASNVIGKRFFHLLENITSRIPILKTTYQVGKQVSMAFSLPEKQAFQKVVLVDYLDQGIFAPAFVTGSVVDSKNEKFLKVFIPTVPNPTTGFVVIVRESQTIDPKWTVEEAMRTIISAGIIGPDTIGIENQIRKVEDV